MAIKSTGQITITDLNDGNDGASVSELVIEYAKNTSTATAPTTGWNTAMPTYAEGYYLWLRTRTKYTNSTSYVYSTPVCDQSWKVNTEVYTQYKQLQDKFAWLVKSGTSESTMVLTDTLFKLVSKNITLEGLITANNNFKILTDGSMEAINGKFTGNITGSNITGSTITSTSSTDASTKVTINDGNLTIVSKDTINGNDTQNITMSLGNGGITIGDMEIANGYMHYPNSFTMDFPIETDYSIISQSYIEATQHIRAGNEVQVKNPTTDGWVRAITYDANDYLIYGMTSKKLLLTSSQVNIRSEATLRLGCSGLNIMNNESHAGIVHLTSYDLSGTTVYSFRPTVTNATNLGSSGNRWQTIYSVNALSASSDRKAKENIEYIEPSYYEANTSNIILDDLYNFVKNDLYLAKYNYKNSDKDTVGFIAQDLLEVNVEDDKAYSIANTIIEVDEENNLSYDTGAYTSVIAGALKKAILKIEELEKEINSLKESR